MLMIDSTDIFFSKVRFLFAGLLIATILILSSVLLFTADPNTVQAKETNHSESPLAAEMSSSPNIVTSSMGMIVYQVGQVVDSTAYSLDSGSRVVASTATRTGKSVADGLKTGASAFARGVASAASFTGRTVVGGVSFVVGIPGDAIGLVANTSAVHSFIRPSEQIEVPIIDPNSPELRAALAALPAENEADATAHQSGAHPAWPIHGQITTHFGVNHWPYQKTHSGIDISDGLAAGITPIKPFRPGQVVETVQSAYGLGNHVIVDHGNGVTSVYAHLASIAVQVGQKVDMNTTLGIEGSTGASTGTHLHFEIRVNGKATDPRQFISGHP